MLLLASRIDLNQTFYSGSTLFYGTISVGVDVPGIGSFGRSGSIALRLIAGFPQVV